MQTGCRLVENVEGATGVALRQLRGELDALRLAAGKRRRRLTEVDVAEPDVEQGLQLLSHARLVLEERQRILDRLLQYVGDAQTAEANLERLTVVALAFADIARNVDVGQEVHLDFDETVSFARLAATTLHVERESSRPIAANLCFWQF